MRRSFAGSGEERRASGTPCPDTELLSAFVDGGLADEERLAIVEHAADCHRCSSILALGASAVDDDAAASTTPAAVRTSSRWRHAYWSVPLATAATIAALWVATPREAVAPTRTIITSADPTVAPAPQPGQAPGASDLFASRGLADSAAEKAVPQERREAAASSAEEPVAAPPPAAPAPASASETIALADPQASPVTPNQQVTARQLAATGVQFSAPGEQVRWRIAADSIERSADGGSTWVAEYQLPRGIVAGVALSPEIAWAGGEAGLVVRRTAGGWALVTPPAQQTIVAIRATSATAATVTLQGGRTMQTTDAGASWR